MNDICREMISTWHWYDWSWRIVVVAIVWTVTREAVSAGFRHFRKK